MDAAQPIRLASQLRQHLRALRENRGLTQSQLGRRLGVRQARVAEIESNPGAVSVNQLIRVFAVLGATLYLDQSNAGGAAPVGTQRAAAKRADRKPIENTRQSEQRPRRVRTAAGAGGRHPKTVASSSSRPFVPSIPKKGTW